MQYRTQIQDWLKAHEEEMLRDLGALIAIPSVRGDAKPDAPFGEHPAAALRFMLEKAKSFGFSIDNVDNYAGCISDGETAQLAMLAHLDVVPAGEGWLHEPFAMTEENGKLIGRGTSDDKGPAVAALYAMRAVKELGIPLQSGVQLVLGTDEENGSSDLAYYLSHRTLPPMVFTPDGDYPVITTEKGMARMEVTAVFDDGASKILSLKAGAAVNAVPAVSEAVLRDVTIDEFLASRTKDYPGIAIGCHVDEEEHLHVTVDGVSAHASTPELGKNALTCLLEVLAPVLGEGAQADAVRTLSACFPYGETDGTACRIAAKDASGALTLVLSVIDLTDTHLTAKLDTRFPTCCKGENVTNALEMALSPLQTSIIMCDEPHHTDENSPFVQTLLHVYEEVTGEPGECLAIGGGTYVHNIEGGVAFGAIFPGEDIHMHGAEEFIRREALLLDAEMMALCIAALCG